MLLETVERRARRWAVPAARRLLGVRRPGVRSAGRRELPPITFFIWNVFSVGGTVRTVVRQASALAALGHDVTIVSVIRHRGQSAPFFDIDDRVAIEILVDRRALDAQQTVRSRLHRRLDARPPLGTQFSMGRERQASTLTDLALLRRVATARGIVIGTRLGLNLAIARVGHPRAFKVAQEHLYLERYDAPPTRRAIERHFADLDLVVSLTEADAAAYRAALGPDGPGVIVVPNAISDELPPPADPRATRLIAVGRLARVKGFDRLIDAFAQVADEYPDWTLRIVGEGGERGKLEQRIADRGLTGRVELPGETPAIQAELGAASVYVLSSRFESFGIVLLEAMATGLAVVSFSCPRGPAEILESGRTGILVRDGDVRALADELRRTLGDEQLRRRLGNAARHEVRRYTASAVTARWAEVLAAAARPDRIFRRPESTEVRIVDSVDPEGPAGAPGDTDGVVGERSA